jgi:hypothetical protein
MIALRAMTVGVGVAALFAPFAIGCHDLSRFSNDGDHYQGYIVGGDFVRAGFDATTQLCLVLDASQLQVAPGTITSSDGRFASTALRTIPQIWHDPLSTLSFGEGRLQNLVYVATPIADADVGGDVFVVVSLMQSGAVEVRILRGAPVNDGGAGAASGNVFGVFSLSRTQVGGAACSF